jgi:hypothetical protein
MLRELAGVADFIRESNCSSATERGVLRRVGRVVSGLQEMRRHEQKAASRRVQVLGGLP